MLIGRLLETVKAYPDRLAVTDHTGEVTYRQLMAMTWHMRAAIDRQVKTDKVGILLPGGSAFAASFYGAIASGRWAVPINFLLTLQEIVKVLIDSGIDTIITSRLMAEQFPAKSPIPLLFVDDIDFKAPPPGDAPVEAGPDDVAVLLYTSGSEGDPKGVMLTHENLCRNVDACIEHARITPDQQLLGILPLFHSFGMTGMMLVPNLLGATVHYLPRFNPQQVVASVRDKRISVIMGVASQYGAMLRVKSATPDDFRTIELAVAGGEPLPDGLVDAFEARLGVRILQGYGLTETSPVVSIDVPWSYKKGTAGRPIPGVDVRVVDDEGKDVAVGAEGEVWIKGHCVMKGYYKRDAETKGAVTPDGWFKTGDCGQLDPDGRLSLCGRIKEMMIVSGENVFPAEIENVIREVPGVLDVAVIGTVDESRGELPVGFVVPEEGAQLSEIAIRDHCRKRLASYKVPRQVFIRTDLPRAPTGKIIKRLLTREMMASSS